MRVGFDARWYNQSGVGSYIAGLLPALIRAGCDLVVYVHAGNPVPGLNGHPVQTVPVSSGKYSPLSSLEFRRLEKRDKLDLFHCPFYAAPLLRCPVVITIHDLIPFLFPIYPWPKQKVVRAGYRVMAGWAAHFIADSRCTASDIQKILSVAPDRISTVHLAADHDTFHPCNAAEDEARLRQRFGISKPFVLVATARNWQTKNLESALQALDIAQRESAVAFQTVMFGPTSRSKPFADDPARTLNLKKPGYVDAKDLAALYRNAHAFVMPSLYEGFGLPLVEAMSCGCPVIASDRGSLPEIAGEGAQCFDAFNARGMAKALSDLLRSPEELRQKRSNALRRAADFSWDKAARETISVYHHVNRFNRRQQVQPTP
ncbi:MAG TPA: glycosyltransferase family 1 protein [Candidatus Binatia bacterium]|nr:glycosyltransferase family 1 protein [Candidatus Binatia bacterium]